MVFSYNKILLPYDGSKPSANALQQAIHTVNDLFACRRETTNSMQGGEGIQIILLHVVEEIHVRFPNMYIGLRMLAGKPLKVFFKEVYEEMRNEASKMLDDTKKQLKSAIKINIDNKSKVLPLSVTVIPQVVSRHICENANCPVMIVH